MATTLRADNFAPNNQKAVTYFEADAAAAATSLSSKNVDGFSNHDFIYLGRLATENSEKQQITGITGNTISIASPGLTFAYDRFNNITVVRGDQIRFYRAANVDNTIPADSAFSLISGGSINISPTQSYTEFVDPSGGSNYWYKFTYYNSYNADETDLADAIAVRGGDYNHYASIDEIRDQAGLNNNTSISDATVADARDDAESEINGYLVSSYTMPLYTPTPSVVTNCTKLLTAGLLLTKDYGVVSKGSAKDGQAMLDQARQILTNIANHIIILTDVTGASLLAHTQVSGWPDDSTADADEVDAGGDRLFRMKHRF